MTESIVARLAAKKLAGMKKSAIENPDELLEDFIIRIHPNYQKPLHLGRALEQFNAIYHRPVRLLLSVPPRHGKSYTVMHLITQYLAKRPGGRVAYASYGDHFAWDQSAIIQRFCIDAGIELSKSLRSTRHWQTANGSSVRAAGINGEWTGKGFDLVIIDDPHKSRAETESAITRDKVYNGWLSDLRTRLEPDASVIIIHTRWHNDDLIGRLSKEDTEGWEVVNIPAINDAGEALWPARYPVEELAKIRAPNEYNWWSLYMGQPRPRGGAVFQAEKTYDTLPEGPPKAAAIGLDLAYTAKKYADFSVAMSGLLYGDTLYITDVRRKQAEPPRFAVEINALKKAQPKAGIWWFIGGIEKGIVTMLRPLVGHINAVNAKDDKFIRAQPVASAWNAGKVLVPRNAPWLTDFLDEVCNFTGVSDASDDQVDALAALFHPLLGKRLPRAAGTTRVTAF